MLKRTAVVVKVKNQDIWVRTDRQSTCVNCMVSNGCGVSLFDKFFSGRFKDNSSKNVEHSAEHSVEHSVEYSAMRLQTQSANYTSTKCKDNPSLQTENVQVGDKVIVGLQENAIIRSSLLVYLVPLVFMLGFALLGQYVYTMVMLAYTVSFSRDSVTICFAIVGFISAFYVVKHVSRTISRDNSRDNKYNVVFLGTDDVSLRVELKKD